MAVGSFKRYRGGILFAVGILALIGLIFASRWACYLVVIGDKEFPQLTPKTVNLIGIRLAGERIIVANGIAQLVQDEGAGFERREAAGEAVGAVGAKIPMTGLVSALQFKPEGVEELVMALNRIEHQILPDESLTWDAEDIRRALDGDIELRKKLELDLVTTFDGEPASLIDAHLTRSGIWIRLPVSVSVPTAEGPRKVESSITLPYATELVQRVRRHNQVRDKFDVDIRTLALVYEEVWEEMPGASRDIRRSLEAFIDPARTDHMSLPAERLLARVAVLVTDDQIDGVTLEEIPRSDGKGDSYTVNLELLRDGRDRLWQYTRRNPGCQLLFVVDGVAIAAPVVQHEMMYYTAAISNIQEEDLARQAVDLIKESKVSKS